jgi:hypothetical protein
MPPMSEKTELGCSVDGCERPLYRKSGFCSAHFERHKKYGDPLAGGVFHQKLPEKCIADGCDKKPLARGLCGGHYSLFVKYGDHTKAKYKWHARGKNQWHEGTNGYIWRYAPGDPNATANSYVYQHRSVMSEKLGRPLRKNENVHHLNGDRKDNRFENLELWVKTQPPGQRVSDLLMWARQILEDYKELA